MVSLHNTTKLYCVKIIDMSKNILNELRLKDIPLSLVGRSLLFALAFDLQPCAGRGGNDQCSSQEGLANLSGPPHIRFYFLDFIDFNPSLTSHFFSRFFG